MTGPFAPPNTKNQFLDIHVRRMHMSSAFITDGVLR